MVLVIQPQNPRVESIICVRTEEIWNFIKVLQSKDFQWRSFLVYVRKNNRFTDSSCKDERRILMANFTYKKTTEEKVTIKGILSEDATTVTVTEKDGDKEVSVKDYLDKFADGYVEITIKNKSEDDLSDSDDE